MNDPGALRWLAAALYLAVALLALRTADSSIGRERTFWLAAALALGALGLAKGLHLQDDLTGALRAAAKAGGWYSWHEDAQRIFVFTVGTVLVVFALLTIWWLGQCATVVKLTAGAVSLFLAFLLIRATSIHAIDSWAMTMAAGLRRGWWVELAALSVIGLLAARRSLTLTG